MGNRIVSFTSNQPQLAKLSRLVVETERMWVHRIVVSPGERLCCESNDKLYLTRTLKGGRVKITDNQDNSAIATIASSEVVVIDVPDPMGEIICLENVGEDKIEFLTVEYR